MLVVLEEEVLEADLVEVLMVVGVAEEEEEVVVEATELVELVEVDETDDDDDVLETEEVEAGLEEELLEEEVVETTLLEDEETAFPERTPDKTLLPAGDALPRADFNQHVPLPWPLFPPT